MCYTEKCAPLLLTIYRQLIERILHDGAVSVDEIVVKLFDPDRCHKARAAWLCEEFADGHHALNRRICK